MDCLLFWVEAHPALAGWLQAIGGLIAVAVAIYVPYRQKNDALEMEIGRINYNEKIKIQAILTLVIQINAFLRLADATANKGEGWLHADIDWGYLDSTLEQMKNIDVIEIPDPTVITYVVLLPISIRELQKTGSSFKGKVYETGSDRSLKEFLKLKLELQALLVRAENACTTKIKSLG
ncbi:hypothetical protein [Methylovorus glucosotrophus]|uniref:hypothetical protein n=1 Tax=Methylovorus glucosotrophus TaxID=266009 RepID=UPI00059ECAAB|nr:hypothetical protein [Methylovorus glucosotrophus]